MAINLDALPESSGAEFSSVGEQTVTIIKAEMGVSVTTGNDQLKVTFKTTKGETLFEYYQESENKFMMFKLRRLLEATGIELSGELTLADIGKMLPREKPIAAFLKTKEYNGSVYGEIDYSSAAGGYGLDLWDNIFVVATGLPEKEDATSMMDSLQKMKSDEVDLSLLQGEKDDFMSNPVGNGPDTQTPKVEFIPEDDF